MTRLIGLVLGLLAVFPASAQVHVPSSASSDNFLASNGSPAIWLPELDAGIPMSGARVFVPGNVDAGRGVPLAFALDGGAIPLTITVDTTYKDPKAEGNWVPFTNMTVAHGYSVNGAIRNVVSPGLYRFFVYDGDGLLNDVTINPRLGADQATAFEPEGIIYAAYLKNVNIYHAVSTDGGITYDPSYTGGSRQGSQFSFPGNVTGVVGLPGADDLLVGHTGRGDAGPAALFTVTRTLKTAVALEDGGHLGQTLEGLAVYHATDVGDGGAGDWALVSSDGRLLLYEVNPNFGFITELVIDGPNPSPYYQGIAVSNLGLGQFDKGVVVVFDASDTFTGSGQLLFVRWDDIVSAVDAGLPIDTSFDVRIFNTTAPITGPGNGTPGATQPPLSGSVGGRNSLMSGSCGGGAEPMLPVAGALVLLGGFAGRRRRP